VIRALLWDAISAAGKVARFIETRSEAEFLADAMLRSAVERQCEIVGEALNRLRATAPDIASGIADLRQAIAFRNLLIPTATWTDLRPPQAAEAPNGARRQCGEAKWPEATPAPEARKSHADESLQVTVGMISRSAPPAHRSHWSASAR
jgi:uncharacterized protein with HEPN domain